MTTDRKPNRRRSVVQSADHNLFRVRTVVKLFSDALTFMADRGADAGGDRHLRLASSHLLTAGQQITYAIQASASAAGERIAPYPPATPGDYLRDCRVSAGLSIADVAARIATVPRLGEIDRQDLIRAIEADARSATIHTLAALGSVFAFSIEEVSRLIDLQDAGPDDFTATEHVSC